MQISSVELKTNLGKCLDMLDQGAIITRQWRKIAKLVKSDCVRAMDIGMSNYEDALTAQCARRIKAEQIITRNTKDLARSPIPAITPRDFLSSFSPE